MILFFFIEVLDYYPQSSISRIHREPELVGERRVRNVGAKGNKEIEGSTHRKRGLSKRV